MTNGEKIQQDFVCDVCEPIVEDNIIHVIFADKDTSAIGFDLDWWNAEYAEQKTEWVPVSERLPEKYGNYLTTVESSDGTATITYQYVDHYGPGWLHEDKMHKVIAWMPLPKPYKESE